MGRFFTFVFAVLFGFTVGAHAQFAGTELPNMSQLNKILGQDAEVEAPKADGLLNSGIPVQDTGYRGTTARKMAVFFGEGMQSEEMQQQFERGFIQYLDQVEGELPALGFSAQDFGVGYAYFFVTTWQLSNDTSLDLNTTKAVGETVVRAMAVLGDQGQSADSIEQNYDRLMTVSVALRGLHDAFRDQGATEEAAAMQGMADELFTKVVGVPAKNVSISPDGQISGLE